MTRPVAIIGHRGARGLFPENTVEGFLAARAAGCTWFELDVGMTRDGAVVVHHDLALHPAIARDASGRWISGTPPLIHDLTLAQLRAYDVGRLRPGAPYRLLYRHQKPIDGARVPLLAEVLRAVPDARMTIEIKTDPRHPGGTAAPEDLADAALAVVTAADAVSRVTFESFDWRGPRHIRASRPDIPILFLTRPETERDATLWWDQPARPESTPHFVASLGVEYWAPDWETLTRASLDTAHGLGLKVVPWTVNRTAAIRKMIRWGVDGLITDRPDLAAAVQSAML